LFAAESLSEAERRVLLSGRSAAGVASGGPLVCACFGVGRDAIRRAVQGGATTVEAIGAAVKAGTNCGSCLPELRRMVASAEPAGLDAASAA
jgi:assimilatory nitrate reductase catalytic subunit